MSPNTNKAHDKVAATHEIYSSSEPISSEVTQIGDSLRYLLTYKIVNE